MQSVARGYSIHTGHKYSQHDHIHDVFITQRLTKHCHLGSIEVSTLVIQAAAVFEVFAQDSQEIACGHLMNSHST